MGVAGTAALGAQVIQGSTRGITPADNTAFGGTFACRNYSVAGTDLGTNNNTPECQDIRCPRSYNTNAVFGLGGYRCNQENTAPYNGDQDDQAFYELVDGEVNAGTCNHIAYYAVQGQKASSTVLVNVGDDRQVGCPGTASVNCYLAVSPAVGRATPLQYTQATYGPVAHQIVNISGLSPVPTVRASAPGAAGCPAGSVRLTWDDPETYAGLMRNAVFSPVQGVNLYVNNASCGACPDGAAGWTLVGSFPMGVGATGVCQLLAGDSWYALTVRMKGPGSAPSSIETGMVGAVGFVGANSQCVSLTPTAARIVSLSARYAGRGRVDVHWNTGAEGGVQGFFVSRAPSPSGPYERVSELIAPTGDGSRYAFSDRVRAGVQGRQVYYRIELARDGATPEYSGVVSAVLPGPRMKGLGLP